MIVVVGFGTAGRVAYSAVCAARQEGIPVGLLRPITLSPFPFDQMRELARNAQAFLVVEMNAGQMFDDVQRAVGNDVPIAFYGRLGGVVPFPDEVLDEIHRIAQAPLSLDEDPRRVWLKKLKELV